MRSELDTDATEETVALAEAIRTGRVAADLMPLWSPVPELRQEPAPAEKLEIAQTRLQAVAAELDELMSTLKRVARDVDEVRAALPSGSTPREETRPRASESVR